MSPTGNSQETIDDQTKKEIETRIKQLNEEISENIKDPKNVEEKKKELDSLEAYLRDATQKNKPKHFQSPEFKKLKTSIGNSITNSINSIRNKENGKKIADHFKNSLSSLYSDKIRYSPNPDIEWHT
jgi:hypothetical protein